MRGTTIAALALATAAPAQTPVADPGDPYVHRATGFAFPQRVGAAIRHRVDLYADDGSDLGAGDQVPRDGRLVAYVTIFVYPTPPANGDRDGSCRDLLAGIG